MIHINEDERQYIIETSKLYSGEMGYDEALALLDCRRDEGFGSVDISDPQIARALVITGQYKVVGEELVTI
jgi:hypothetical protein